MVELLIDARPIQIDSFMASIAEGQDWDYLGKLVASGDWRRRGR